MRKLKPLKIGYFADGIWAHNAFEKLISCNDFHIAFITPRFYSTDETLKTLATTYNIPYIKAKNINSPAFLSQIAAFECDIFVSMSFDQIFKEPLISMPRLKSINCHAGKLPFYRGRNVLNWVLINDEKSFGISVHYIDSGIDTGDIILQREFPISDEDCYSTLLHTAHTECAQVLFSALMLLHKGEAKPIRQTDIHKIGFYCPARIAGDEWIHWDKPSRFIFNFIRALNAPDLGALTQVCTQGDTFKVRIFKAHFLSNAPCYIATPGVIVGIQKRDGHKPILIVKTQDSTISISEYITEAKLRIGDRFFTPIGYEHNILTGGGDKVKNTPIIPAYRPHKAPPKRWVA